jgi:hypothetical protein
MAFRDVIKQSLLSISRPYFEQDTVNPSRKKYGERVFCYEFYHQLRLRSGELEGLTISGDTVKSSFQFPQLSQNRSPDILIHNFGNITDNQVVIEVKTAKDRGTVYKGIDKDLETLNLFTREDIDYQLGIYLLVNHDFWELCTRSQVFKAAVLKHVVDNPRIEIWNIAKPELEDGRLKSSCLKCYTSSKIKEEFKLRADRII